MKTNVLSFMLATAMQQSIATAIAITSARSTPQLVSSSPFYDCVSTGGSWQHCHLVVQNLTTAIELEDVILTLNYTPTATPLANTTNVTVTKRSTPTQSNIAGTDIESGISFAQSEECYSVNNLGGTGWLTNTAVKGLADSACTAAVSQALSTTSGLTPGLGFFTKTLAGYYMGNGGPIADSKVGFYLSTLFSGDFMDLIKAASNPNGFSLQQLGHDLCMKGIDRLTSDDGCTAARKSGGITEHTSVNGGQFSFAHGDGTIAGDAPTPIFNSAGQCTNCVFQIVMEAANNVDKTGSTSVSEDTKPS